MFCFMFSGALKLSSPYFGVCPVYIIFLSVGFVVKIRGILFQSSLSRTYFFLEMLTGEILGVFRVDFHARNGRLQ